MQLTPAMRQYQDMKKQYVDCILFFRIGDFYEVFFEDANICHRVLDLVLTSKNKNSEHPIPMAGIPHHSIDKYIPKLIQHGYKVAIAEQTSDPIPGKIVQREISQIITPGTYIQEWSKKFNYMLALTARENKHAEKYHLAWGDFSVGEYWTKSFNNLWDVQKWILTLNPSEIILDVDFREKDSISTPIQNYLKCLISVYEIPSDTELFLTNICNVQSLHSFGQAVHEGRLEAISLLLNYIKHTQQNALGNIYKISYHAQLGMVLMDDITIKNLELFSSSYEASEKYSLIGILDRTKTTSGARYLRYLLSNPINSLNILQERQQHISRYLEHEEAHTIMKQLSLTFDINKLISTIVYRKLHPIPFIKLRNTLNIFFNMSYEYAPMMKKEMAQLGLSRVEEEELTTLLHELQRALKEDDEVRIEMDFIKDGYHAEIDQLRKIAYHSDELLMGYQQFLVQHTGISNIKLKYVMNQGYFIELTTKDSEILEWKLLSHSDDSEGKLQLSRRQTLKGNQRYSSPYLEHIQESILSSKAQLGKLEYELLGKLGQQIGKISSSLYHFAEKIAELDVYCSHALFAKEYQYIQPQLSQQSILHIVGGRHPVIEAYLPRDQQFIPNNLRIGNQLSSTTTIEQDNGLIHIITGPNMWGKSTYLRQSALIVLLAHCGLFVPAKEAHIGLIDGLFARVWSWDVIAKNQSTFMTEMIEVSNILNNATKKSFIIFDELGRGTSTYDGLALTSAILQYLLKEVGAKTLIATHYHELINLEKQYPEVRNFSVSVYETEKEVLFMKKIVQGWANKSYGIDVAKIAGIPDKVLQLARNILKSFETDSEHSPKLHIQSTPLFQVEDQSKIYQKKYEQVKRIISQADVNNMTPLQAIQFLAKVKDELDE